MEHDRPDCGGQCRTRSLRIRLDELPSGSGADQVRRNRVQTRRADFRSHPRKNAIVQEYVLPDFSPASTSRTGYIRSGPNAAPPPVAADGEVPKARAVAEGEEEQVLYMGNERFVGPELLFNPSDIGTLLTALTRPLDSRSRARARGDTRSCSTDNRRAAGGAQGDVLGEHCCNWRPR